MASPTLLHVFPMFKPGGAETRTVTLINALGDKYHNKITALHESYDAAKLIDPGVPFEIPEPPYGNQNLVGRLVTLQRWLKDMKPDLVLTHNWGAIEVALAAGLAGLPLIHHEDGFNEDEAVRQKPRRVWFRRLVLPRAYALVVPSKTLARIAHDVWKRPEDRISVIANGVDTALYAEPPARDALPGFVKPDGQFWIGSVARLSEVKNLPRLVRLFARATQDVDARLVIIGDGPARPAIEAEAQRQGVADRLIMPGFVPHPHTYVGLLDVFALSSDSEQFPISLVEAMAAGLPALCTDVGDIRGIVASENAPFLHPPLDEAGLAAALRRLLLDADLRAHVGAANRVRVAREYSLARMIETYDALYQAALR
jgi:L-malate glycosyltransferase